MTSVTFMVDRRTRTDRRRPSRHPLADDLAAAMQTGVLDILFQPQFACKDNALSGAEALVRWEHGVHGDLAGDAVFDIAAGSGQSLALSAHVRRAALAEATKWPENLRLSLNVTARDLEESDFAEAVLEELRESGFPADRLTLEITEQALLDDVEESARILSRLTAAGVAISLDDFGAGFCNFQYLKALPLAALKLDRSMVTGVCSDPRDLAVFRGIVAMAKALDLRVVAEGIETEAQRDAVKSEGCDRWQGFLGGKPMPAKEFANLI
ncbi:EAL domain-containing protein [Paraurantiacibacter namhicola]|uniref:Phytochrome-like protein cph2 n=1 Tax=Paraurantiacibacter namhicola TaxID=645517 RepID=A0A1C7D9Q8_9SPHN|nr:EAL domain-containing protein [Paraurantiacibacter namhicola]ANU08167.1 Phytochrome-like protein cph2 [Paraurantiacibacter namhicola]